MPYQFMPLPSHSLVFLLCHNPTARKQWILWPDGYCSPVRTLHNRTHTRHQSHSNPPPLLLQTCMTFPTDFKIVVREYYQGCNGPVAYFLGRNLASKSPGTEGVAIEELSIKHVGEGEPGKATRLGGCYFPFSSFSPTSWSLQIDGCDIAKPVTMRGVGTYIEAVCVPIDGCMSSPSEAAHSGASRNHARSGSSFKL